MYPKTSGFSLMELLVVLGLISLIGGVVFPGLGRLYTAVSINAEQESILADINSMGVRAWREGQAFTLAERIELPENWEYRVIEPVHYRPNGVCLGGSAQLMRDGQLLRSLSLQAPYCQIRDET